MASSSGGGLREQTNDSVSHHSQMIAIDFQRELNSILDSRPPVSKEKMNKIVKEALKEIRHYKHVVYFVENFIKNVNLFLN